MPTGTEGGRHDQEEENCSPELKAKIVRELVEGDDGVGVVAAKHHLNASMVSGWRKQPFDNAELICAQDQQIRKAKAKDAEHGKEVDNPSRIIGQLTVERDCLQRSLGEKLDGLGP